MAYICDKNIQCNKCQHYRYDDDSHTKACFAAIDEKIQPEKAVHHTSIDKEVSK